MDVQKLCAWRMQGVRDCKGVVVASDARLEWLIPWWWERYSRYNAYPVAFVDYGMSEEMRKWCAERGEVVPLSLPDLFSAGNALLKLLLLDKDVDEEWFFSRNAWFKKPFACLHSPFKKSVWIDLDCEMKGSIEPLFAMRLALALDHYADAPYYPVYNSGVIAFEHGVSLFEEWADLCVRENHTFPGDQEVLSWLIEQKKCIVEMPAIYNWSRLSHENPQAVIVHWHGPVGKEHIIKELYE
jgi:hypothetical protein